MFGIKQWNRDAFATTVSLIKQLSNLVPRVLSLLEICRVQTGSTFACLNFIVSGAHDCMLRLLRSNWLRNMWKEKLRKNVSRQYLPPECVVWSLNIVAPVVSKKPFKWPQRREGSNGAVVCLCWVILYAKGCHTLSNLLSKNCRFLLVSNRFKICRDISLPHTSRIFVGTYRVQAWGRVIQIKMAPIRRKFTIPHWLRYAGAPANCPGPPTRPEKTFCDLALSDVADKPRSVSDAHLSEFTAR